MKCNECKNEFSGETSANITTCFTCKTCKKKKENTLNGDIKRTTRPVTFFLKRRIEALEKKEKKQNQQIKLLIELANSLEEALNPKE